jgi:hypothetical protein
VQVFGWIKQTAFQQELRTRGRPKLGVVFRLDMVPYNLIRITNPFRTQEVKA